MSTTERSGEPLPAERRQREFELSRAIEVARALQARLEMLGDRAADVAVVRSLRDSLARDLAGPIAEDSPGEEYTEPLKPILRETDR